MDGPTGHDEDRVRRLGAGASESDVIVAPATAPGRAALAVVRLSGPDVLAVRSACFRAAASDRVPDAEPNRATFGRWTDPARSGETIDEAMVTWYRAPRSYTGEEMLEISCHGSNLAVQRILESCTASGARMARPGEFTERAFLNGKIDLSRAQAVAEVIDAATRQAQRHALTRLRGGLEREVLAIEDDLTEAAALIEAYLDFPEEDLGAEDRAIVERHLRTGSERLERLLATWQRGRLEAEGVRVVLAGEPNVGKSSLFNALLGKARALVTAIAGTTRDTIDARLDIGGVPVTLIDTAGLREAGDEVERLGVGRTEEALADADAVLWLFDGTLPLSAQRPERVIAWLDGSRSEKEGGGSEEREERDVLIVLNKRDRMLPEHHTARFDELERLGLAGRRIVEVAAVDATTLGPLLQALTDLLLQQGRPGHARELPPDAVVVADSVQHATLEATRDALGRAEAAFRAESSGELVMVDLQEALDNLAQITGTSISEEKLNRVFRRFCLGK